MTKPDDIRRQQDRRLGELMAIARQRFLNAGGDPRHLPSGLKGDDYMTDEERQEALSLARELFNDEYINNYLEKKRQQKGNSQKVS